MEIGLYDLAVIVGVVLLLVLAIGGVSCFFFNEDEPKDGCTCNPPDFCDFMCAPKRRFYERNPEDDYPNKPRKRVDMEIKDDLPDDDFLEGMGYETVDFSKIDLSKCLPYKGKSGGPEFYPNTFDLGKSMLDEEIRNKKLERNEETENKI